MMRSFFAEVVVHILHDLHSQPSDDEEESGPSVSQVTGPEESAARLYMSPIPTHDQIRGNCQPPSDTPHTRKLSRSSLEGIGMRFYETL